MSGAPLRVLIADDEAVARARLRRLLAALPAVELVAECESGSDALARLRAGGIDVALLDVQMPGLSGLETVLLLPEPRPHVIFCTAHADFAVSAFEVGAVDYLLKPIAADRLARALERAHERAASAGPDGLVRLALPTRAGVVLLDPLGISHALLENEVVTIHSTQGTFFTELSLQALQDRLPPGRFQRVHRRALLNLERVERLEPIESGGYLARTRDGHAVTISRQAARALRRRLGLARSGEEPG